MEVKVAKSAGFCFGVRRAVQLVYDEAEKEEGHVYTMGPIIHNEQVVEDLEEKGVFSVDDDLICEKTGLKPPAGSVVIVRSHGISRDMSEMLDKSGYRIIDATCPFVDRIHKIVAEKSKEGYQIVIIGNPAHPEVCGIRGWAGKECRTVESKEDAENLALSFDRPVCIVSQTTFNYDKFQELVEIIKTLGYHVIVINTICSATKERQMEALELAGQSDAMIVIGGKKSSNTQKLYDICRSQCENTYYIQTLDDLVTVNFQSDRCVGITAGASTPNNIIQEVSTHVRGTKF
ncbi:MAG TPA: 4-hydroxy-3-methylbut-2-enyl diphosphate reductase [Lachnospiraceae bacterium]|nr:4-hydroxy-3-methylbut-2-enyl diphosphate reductase [Lachnospiraceae bacterium]